MSTATSKQSISKLAKIIDRLEKVPESINIVIVPFLLFLRMRKMVLEALELNKMIAIAIIALIVRV